MALWTEFGAREALLALLVENLKWIHKSAWPFIAQVIRCNFTSAGAYGICIPSEACEYASLGALRTQAACGCLTGL